MTDDQHLSQIVTLWSVVRRAHDGQADSIRSAQEEMLDRYGGAVRRYLLGALRDPDAADEVFQEFALRFVRGDFQSADPQLGRFRSYLKTVVYRLIVDHQRRRNRQARNQPLPEDGPLFTADTDIESDERFLQSWREELLARAWQGLEDSSDREGSLHYHVLRLRAERPELRSAEIAEQLSRTHGKPLTAGNIRVLLHRARQKFAERLLEQVSHSLASGDREQVEQELITLNLHDYCRDCLG